MMGTSNCSCTTWKDTTTASNARRTGSTAPPGTVAGRALADGARIELAVRNLVSNGIKLTGRGGRVALVMHGDADQYASV